MNHLSCSHLIGAFLLATSFPAAAQFSFTDRTNLLSNSGLGNNRCNSSVAIGVVDMNGDGKDDIIRLHQGVTLAIESQAAPNAAFGHLLVGNIGIDPWALCVADVDKNGFNDIVFGPFTGGMKLYKANADATAYSGEDLPNSSSVACQGTLFADINNDGEIDLFSCHDVADNAKWENFGNGVLLRNDSLLETDLGSNSAGNYAALWTDYDKDGNLDLYLTKCSQGSNNPADPKRINRMFKGDGDGGFSDVAPSIGLADGAQSWSTDFADIDNDGDLDAFILNHPESGSPRPSRLMENVGGSFQDITAASGLSPSLAVFGIQTVFRDFDNDGFIDLFVSTNGASGGYRIFKNNGDKTFTNQDDAFVVGGTTGGAGTSLNYIQSFGIGDLNHDGFLDVYAGRATGFANPSSERDLMFMNDGNSNNFLTLQLTGTLSHPNAIGARIEIFGPWGVQTREVRAGEGYGIQNSLSAHFGLGTETTVDRVLITWPSGFTNELTDVAANQFLAVTETIDPSDFSIPSITSPTSVTTPVGGTFSYRIRAKNYPTSYSLANAPTGMSVTEFGTVTWVPASEGIFTFDAIATNPAGSDTKTVSVEVLADSLPGSFEATVYTVDTSASYPWAQVTSPTHDNQDAAASADIDDGESSWLQVTVEGPGEASFWWRVSSEGDFDFLIFSVNGSDRAQISGNSGWLQRSITLGDGPQVIRWTYSKDGSVDEGQDKGWVDEFSYTPDFMDNDSDGLEDSWETTNFGNLAQTGGDDFDGDGQDNASEQASGTSPIDPLSLLQLTGAEAVGSTGLVQLSWDSTSDIVYTVQSSPDLSTWTDVQSGIAGTGGVITQMVAPGDGPQTLTLIPEVAPAHTLIPTGDIGSAWRGGDEVAFAAAGGTSGWTAGDTGVGYERTSGYEPFFNTDVESDMFNRNGSAYIRIPFEVADPTSLTSLFLDMRYDDGFVAYLNGQAVASENVPASPTWDSDAGGSRGADAVDFDEFDLGSAVGGLVPGTNILAIHGMNHSPGSSDFLIQPMLRAESLAGSGAPRFYWRVVIK